jgi:DNA-binding CsgD family transcriptional regulator/PAS domain-containing protein
MLRGATLLSDPSSERAGVIGAVCAAVQEPSGWPDAVAALKTSFRAAAAWVWAWNEDGAAMLVASAGRGVNWSNEAGPGFARIGQETEGLSRLEDHRLTTNWSIRARRWRMSIVRRAEDLAFEAHDVAAFGEVVAHLRQVLETRGLARAQGAALALDSLSSAIVVTEASGRIVVANRAAHALLSAGRGVCLRGERIAAELPDDDGVLMSAVAAAVGGTRRTSFTIPSNSGATHLVIGPLGELGYAMICGTESTIDANLARPLREAFGFTRAEARLAIKLLAGQTVSEAATASSVSVNTARSHIRAMLAKTDATRLVEMLRILRSTLAIL